MVGVTQTEWRHDGCAMRDAATVQGVSSMRGAWFSGWNVAHSGVGGLVWPNV